MKAFCVHQSGATGVQQLEDVPPLQPGDGQLLVRVHAAGVNPADWYVVNGLFEIPPVLPFTPGFEAAGEVVQVGGGVDIRKGSRVCLTLPYLVNGNAQFGAFAEQVVVPAANVIPIPDRLDFSAAAAFPVMYGTAHIALKHRAQLKPGETLLVTGGTGATGFAAIQIGRQLGATVIVTTSGAEKLEKVKALGADYAIDYKQENVAERVLEITKHQGANVVFETVGGELFEAAVQAIAWSGRLLPIGVASGKVPELDILKPLARNFSIVGTNFASYTVRAIDLVRRSLTEILDWYDQGLLQVVSPQQVPLSDAAVAVESVRSGQAGGKFVLQMLS